MTHFIFYLNSSEKSSEDVNEQKNEMQAEANKKEVPETLVDSAEGEQKLPLQPDGSSTHTQTEVVPQISEPKVKEVWRIQVYS